MAFEIRLNVNSNAVQGSRLLVLLKTILHSYPRMHMTALILNLPFGNTLIRNPAFGTRMHAPPLIYATKKKGLGPQRQLYISGEWRRPFI